MTPLLLISVLYSAEIWLWVKRGGIPAQKLKQYHCKYLPKYIDQIKTQIISHRLNIKSNYSKNAIFLAEISI